MPTKHVTSEIMRSGSGKHWTRAELAARQASEELLKREKKRSLNAPVWLTKEAKAIWIRVVGSVKGLDLLDNIDTEILAIYADAVVRYQILSQKETQDNDDIKALQAYSRIIVQYADKLGLTPTARARIVKKHADKLLDRFGKKFD
jgi:P27 family predicted phage terminase small subunit